MVLCSHENRGRWRRSGQWGHVTGWHRPDDVFAGRCLRAKKKKFRVTSRRPRDWAQASDQTALRVGIGGHCSFAFPPFSWNVLLCIFTSLLFNLFLFGPFFSPQRQTDREIERSSSVLHDGQQTCRSETARATSIWNPIGNTRAGRHHNFATPPWCTFAKTSCPT